MADAAPAPVVQKVKAKKAAKPKKPSAHPKYSEMVTAAVASLKERGGSSRVKILKYIMANFKVGDEKSVNSHLKIALRNGVKNGVLKQTKGTGATGSFRLGEKSAKKAPAKAKKPKKPAAKKPAAKKPKAKKPKSPKKTKKPAAKKPKAAKPAAKKSPKKAAKKPATKKPKAAKPAKKTPKKAAKKPAKK